MGAGAADVLLGGGQGFLVQVRGTFDALAETALQEARTDLLALAPPGRPPRLTGPVPAPGGPVLRVALLEADDERLRSIPDLVAKRLHDAGVTDAVVHVIAPGGPLEALEQVPGAAILRIFPMPAGDAGVVPAGWLDAAVRWVAQDHAPHEPVALRLVGLEHPIAVERVGEVLAEARRCRAWCDVVHGDPDDRIRSASLTFGSTPHLALAAGGRSCTADDLAEAAVQLAELARELAADITYACVDVERTFEGVGTGLPTDGWSAAGGADPNVVASQLGDIRVPGVYGYQILGPGHLAVLGPGPQGGPALGEALPGGRAGVAVGAPVDWVPGSASRADAIEEGIELLRPLLVGADEVERIVQEHPADLGAADGAGAGPEIDAIELGPVPHVRRGLHLTLLELAAWLAGEPHSDAPACVSPVVATYARWLASAVDDEVRQTLKPLAARLIGTAAPGDAPAPGGRLSERDGERVWQATEWIVRVQAPAWLRAAGFDHAAERLETTRPRTIDADVLRAVDIMAEALLGASRRIDLALRTVAESRGDTVLVEEAAWEAWELASERSGWVAAAETAALGMPAALLYAADSRVVECVRDARRRGELDTGEHTVGDAAWAAALHAAARHALDHGLRAARRARSDVGLVPFDTALERARRAVADRSPEPEQVALALDAAEAAAVDRLVTVALQPETLAPGETAWDAALAAARQGPDGAVFAQVEALTRDAVAPEAWEAAMGAAREAVAAAMERSPDEVARAVVGALAKEVASAAARGVAVRAAAVADARGDGPDEVVAAARDAVAETAAVLQDAAIRFLEGLVGAEAQPSG